MIRRILRLVVVPGVFSAALACGGQAPTSSAPAGAPTGEVVARIGKSAVTLEQIQKKLDEQSPFVRARYADMEKRQELLDAQVRFEVLAAEAKERGYENDPEVADAVKKILVQRLTREEFDGRVQLKDIGDADLQRYFDEHKADYQKPEMVRASVITIAAATPDAKSKIEDAHKQASDPKKKDDRALFKELVAKLSTDDATKSAGGDIRYVSRDDVVGRYGKDIADWLFSSDETGVVSPVFTSSLAAGQAFHVFVRTGKRKAIDRSFDQVKNQIKNVVYREKRTAAFNAFVDELKTKHHVTTTPEKLAGLKIPAVPEGVPGNMALDDLAGHGGHGGHGGHADNENDAPAPAAPAGTAPSPAPAAPTPTP